MTYLPNIVQLEWLDSEEIALYMIAVDVGKILGGCATEELVRCVVLGNVREILDAGVMEPFNIMGGQGVEMWGTGAQESMARIEAAWDANLEDMWFADVWFSTTDEGLDVLRRLIGSPAKPQSESDSEST